MSRRHLRSLGLSRALDRRHSYMRVQEYLNLRGWKQQLRRLAQRMSLHSDVPQHLAEAAYCLAAHNFDRRWALFDLGLLVDIAIYEAQATRRDPDQVLSVQALRARQRLLDLAFARRLVELRAVPVQENSASTQQLVDAEQGGGLLPWLHRGVLWWESPAALRDTVETSLTWLQPRRADQAIFVKLQIDYANAQQVCVAAALYCDFAGPCPPQLLGPCPEIPLLGTEAASRLPELLAREPRWLRLRLRALGAYASNRFYALYDLGPSLARAGRLQEIGMLWMLGASVHFALQLRDAESLRRRGHSWSLDSETELGAKPETAQPRFKSYHYWTEALLGCMQRDRGERLQNTVDAAGVIGAHYRRWMTPMYVVYRLFHGGGVEQIDRDNQWAVTLHRQGAQVGYQLCGLGRP